MGRLGMDIAVAYHNTFHNPSLDLITYFGARYLTPKLFAFMLGTLQGFNAVILFFIARVLRPAGSKRLQDLSAAGLALVGGLGAGALGEVGTTFGDNLVSLPILSAFYFSIRPSRWPPFAQWGLVGLMVGLAAGLKPTTLLYAVGMGVALFASEGRSARLFARLLGFAAGFSAGFLVTAGHWCWFLWRTYGNPFFPYGNEVFRSPFAVPWDYRDVRYLPKSLLDALATPFYAVFSPLRLGEISFFDLRLPAVVTVVMLYGLVRLRGNRPSLGATARVLVVAYAASLALWVASFSIYRYAIPLEMLAPIVIAAVVAKIGLSDAKQGLVVFVTCAACLVTTRPGDWRRLPWGSDLFGVTLPAAAGLEGSLVFVNGTWPLAYIAAALPRTTPILRLEANGDPMHSPYFPGPEAGTPTRLEQMVRGRIAAHSGRMYLLARTPARADYGLAVHDLRRSAAPCHDFKPYIEDRPLHLCEVERIPRRTLPTAR